MKKQAFSKAAIGAVVTVLLILVITLATPGRVNARGMHREFRFVSFSQVTSDGVVHRIAMSGSGTFNPGDSEAAGRGNYVHFNNTASGVPKPILDSGTWKVTQFVSVAFCGQQLSCGSATPSGTYGRITPGILELRVELISDVDSTVTPATLRLICNVGAAGIDTGQPEGYTLDIDGTSFGRFTPVLVSGTPLGITHLGVEPGTED
jgi:hypothetical protein